MIWGRLFGVSCLCGLALLINSCSGGSSSRDAGATALPTECDGSCVETQRNGSDANVSLTVADVQTVISQAVFEAEAQGAMATIAVTDRVGNVLGVWQMDPQARVLIATDPIDLDNLEGSRISGGLEGIAATGLGLDALAAIAKAVTGSYLSSEGNAFSSRVASQIVQEHFNPGEMDQPGGPLFGVQFSQLACSDFINRFNGVGPSVGPQRSPLGLSADPGGFPLYKNGTVVGGVGVISDGIYGIDPSIGDIDRDMDEIIATAATFGYAAPLERRGDRITVEGKQFRFTDTLIGDIATNPTNAPAFPPATGSLIPVTGYNNGVISAGTVFGQGPSGIRAANPNIPNEAPFVDGDGFVFVDAANNNRFPPINGAPLPGGMEITNIEVQTILQQGLGVANEGRAQIRQPLSTPIRVTISVVDTEGNIVGIVRTRDAPVFGADVSLQKARTAAFFSGPQAASILQTPNIDARYLALPNNMPTTVNTINLGDYVTDARMFLANAKIGPENGPKRDFDSSTALADGGLAFSDRAGGNLSRPFFPDGKDGNPHGPFSKAPGFWSPFSTGLQLDMVYNGILQHVLFAATGGAIPDVSIGCGGVVHNPLLSFAPSPLPNALLANGIQIFPGSVPIYRGNTLIGGIGISGDGVDQDDMVAFLGVDRASRQAQGGAINNAPPEIRSDQLDIPIPGGSARLRFVQCPNAPFIGSDEQQPCNGK